MYHALSLCHYPLDRSYLEIPPNTSQRIQSLSAEMSKPGDYDAVRRDIAAQLKKPDYDDGSAGPVFVRLAWYAFPTARCPEIP